MLKRIITFKNFDRNDAKSLNIGDTIKCKLISKRQKHYLIQNIEPNLINDSLIYVMPIAEAIDITETNIIKKKEIIAKVLYFK